jgi:NAD(P)H-hydrate epimerase
MRLVTNKEMQAIDTWAIRKFGIPGPVLMENAGQGCVNVLEEYYDLQDLRVLIVCGHGNNGGDGFVIARLLQNRGAHVQVVLPGKGTLKKDARLNYDLARKAGIEINKSMTMAAIRRQYERFRPDVIIDALFGTGFSGTLKGIYRATIEFMNSSDVMILSVDIPSGVNGDTGSFDTTCVIADVTATMCLPKRGHYLYPGREFCGDLHIVDIGIPYNTISDGFPHVLEFETIRSLLPFRPPDGHKGTFGNILIIAGARGYSGAAAMAASAALYTGAGYVRLAAPRGIIDALESKLLEVVKIPLEQTAQETISPHALGTLMPHIATADVVVIGPGLTTHPETAEFFHSLLPYLEQPTVIDADALNIIAQDPRCMKHLHVPLVVTPHPGELSRITGLTAGDINAGRIDLAKDIAKKWKCTMILKGAPTVIASSDGSCFVNPTGNNGMASAGSGDVLIGMLSGFIAQQCSPLEASMLSVFLHGLSGDLAAADKNEYSITASDLLEYIPDALNYVLREQYIEDIHNE